MAYERRVTGYGEITIANTGRVGEVSFTMLVSGNRIAGARFAVVATPEEKGATMRVRLKGREGYFHGEDLEDVYREARDEIQDRLWNAKRPVPHFVWNVESDLRRLGYQPDLKPID